MLKHYFKVAWRTVWRSKLVSFVNLAGLTLALATVVVIAIYVRYELSFDRHFATADRLYRLYSEDTTSASGENRNLKLPVGLSDIIAEEVPGISAHTELYKGGNKLRYEEKNFDVSFVEGWDDFFELFPFEFVAGSPSRALVNENDIVLTESTARKFFGEEDPLNKILFIGNRPTYRVTGVIRDIPGNTHFSAEAIVKDRYSQPFTWKGDHVITYHYLLLEDAAMAGKVELGIQALHDKYGFPENTLVKLQKVTDIHLHSNFRGELGANADIQYIYIFICAAILILLVASINYLNLSTARFFHRSLEVGVRKVIGGDRKGLMLRFLAEAALFFTLAVLLAIILGIWMYSLLSKHLQIDMQALTSLSAATILSFTLFILLSGLLAGLYPAFVLSRKPPAFIMKGSMQASAFSVDLRKTLIVFQFVITVFFLAATAAIYQQLTYIQERNLGFDKESLLMIGSHSYRDNLNPFKTELLRSSLIKSASLVNNWEAGREVPPISRSRGDNPSIPDSTRAVNRKWITADVDFIKTLKINIKAGRGFSSEFSADSVDAVILNETMVKELELQEPVVGTVLNYRNLHGRVIGVVADFNTISLHHAVEPTVIYPYEDGFFGYMYIRIHPGNVSAVIRYINQQWNTFYPKHDLELSFVDDNLQQLYSGEQRMGELFAGFAFLSILIVCSGLFGLVVFMVEKRTKEIGIRKVLGASVAGIVMLLSKDFIKLVLVAAVIATPIAWYTMNRWLEDFAYRIELQWWVFVLAGLLAAVIALLTVSFQSVKAAFINPVKSLRSE